VYRGKKKISEKEVQIVTYVALKEMIASITSCIGTSVAVKNSYKGSKVSRLYPTLIF
jgi:hypothetical protein